MGMLCCGNKARRQSDEIEIKELQKKFIKFRNYPNHSNHLILQSNWITPSLTPNVQLNRVQMSLNTSVQSVNALESEFVYLKLDELFPSIWSKVLGYLSSFDKEILCYTSRSIQKVLMQAELSTEFPFIAHIKPFQIITYNLNNGRRYELKYFEDPIKSSKYPLIHPNLPNGKGNKITPNKCLSSYEYAYIQHDHFFFVCGGKKSITSKEYYNDAFQIEFFIHSKNNIQIVASDKPINQMIFPKCAHSLVLILEYIVSVGGQSVDGDILSCEYYSQKSKRWKKLPDLNESKRKVCSTQFNQKYIFCFGGIQGYYKYCATIEKFNFAKEGSFWKTISLHNYYMDDFPLSSLMISHINSFAIQIDGNTILFLGSRDFSPTIFLFSVKDQGIRKINCHLPQGDLFDGKGSPFLYNYKIFTFGNQYFHSIDLKEVKWNLKPIFEKDPDW